MALTKSDLTAIDKIVSKRTRPLEKGQKKIQKDLKTVINYFDDEHLKLKKRVSTVEMHLGVQSPDF